MKKELLMLKMLCSAPANDPSVAMVLGLAMIFIFALWGKELMARIRQTAVLGYLLAGITLGNLKLFGIDALHFLLNDSFINTCAQFGVVILMFEAGLESSVHKMKQVGFRAAAVALSGVVASVLLGFWSSKILFSSASSYSHWFVGVMIASTSVGVAAAVLKEMRKLSSPIADLILGAAIIDDVLGLICLAVIDGVIKGVGSGEKLSLLSMSLMLFKALFFIGSSVMFGDWVSKHSFKLASKLQSNNVLLTVALSFCLLFCWAASVFGLAPMIGAFAAGLILEHVHYRDLQLAKNESDLDNLLKPISQLFVPMFFVIVGTKVNLSVMTNFSSLKIAVVLIVAATLGKIACAIGLIGKKDVSTGALVSGMLARGEVVVVIASQGMNLYINGKSVVSPELFAAVIVMVVFTTVVTPPMLNKYLKN